MGLELQRRWVFVVLFPCPSVMSSRLPAGVQKLLRAEWQAERTDGVPPLPDVIVLCSVVVVVVVAVLPRVQLGHRTLRHSPRNCCPLRYRSRQARSGRERTKGI